MLVPILGDIGTGKTLLATIIASLSQRDVYANYPMNIPQYHALEVTDILEIAWEADFIIDEAYAWLESRGSAGDDINKVLSYILFQSRKRNVNFYLTAQLYGTVDCRFRQESDLYILCDATYRFDELLGYIPIVFKYNIVDKRGRQRRFELLPEVAAEYYPLYDTMGIVEPLHLPELQASLLKRDGKQFYDKAKEIALRIYPDLKDVTHASVDARLLALGESLKFSKYVYIICKDRERTLKKKHRKKRGS